MIHPSIRNKADKLGLIGEDNPNQIALLKVKPDNVVQFHWPSKNVYAFGIGGKAAMAEAEAIMAIARMDPDWRIVNSTRDPFMIELFNKDRSLTFIRGGATPQDTLAELNGKDGEREWLSTTVPDDGGEAYRQGFTAGDNPWRDTQSELDAAEEGDDAANDLAEKADAWDEAFDAAADEQTEAEAAEEGQSGSVVKETYRIRYAEAGHPNHCGDWLAETLNNLILGKSHTDLANFELLCEVNGVSTAKYKREGNGWEGRIRMTGRNLLARKLYATGFMIIPEPLRPLVDGQQVLRVPREWIETRTYRGKSALDDPEYIGGEGLTPSDPEGALPVEGAAPETSDTPVIDMAEQSRRRKASRGK